MSRRPKPPKAELSDAGYNVLHEREGLRLEAYVDTTGVLTIGLGHTSAAGPPEVYQGMVITEEEAETIFRNDCQTFRDEVIASVTGDMTQNEFDAACSLLYNIGSPNFLGSTFLKKVNANDKDGAAEAILMWNQPSEIMNRRRGEYYEYKDGRYDARVDENGNAV